MSDLSPVSISSDATNRSPIQIDGAFHATFEGRSHMDDQIVCDSMIYVSRDLTVMYFSYDTMVVLGIVNHDFPIVGQFSPSSNPIPSQKPSSASNDMTGDSTGQICRATKIDRQVCQFPKWNPVLDCLTVFPFTCTSDNNDRMYK